MSTPPTPRLRIAIAFGGRSAEHEISLLSARFVLESLDPVRFEPVLVGIDKNGRWLLQEPSLLLQGPRDPRAVALDGAKPHVLMPPHPGAGLIAASGVGAAGALGRIDAVFPVLHGPLGEDGTVQGLFELAGVPYVGSGVLGSAVGLDKDVKKRLLAVAGLPLLPYRTVRRAQWDNQREAALTELRKLRFPLFVKPANLGSSVGVTRVPEESALGAAIAHAFEFDDKIVVEEGLDRPREIECAVLGGEPPFASMPGEIVVSHRDGFYSYAAKYLDADGAATRIPADLPEAQAEQARRLALGTFEALEAEGLARVDMFLDASGRFYVN